jgi:hypothetical protein
MLKDLAEAVTAGGATALSFTALGAILLAFLAHRLFAKDHVAVRLFIYLTIFVGAGAVYYTQIVPPKAAETAVVAEPVVVATAGAPPAEVDPVAPEAAPAVQAPPALTPPDPVAEPAPPPPVPLDVLAQQSDRLYDEGNFTEAFALNAQGCSRGAAISCRWNGYLLENGKGFAADRAKALDWYGRGCSLGDGGSCERKEALAAP